MFWFMAGVVVVGFIYFVCRNRAYAVAKREADKRVREELASGKGRCSRCGAFVYGVKNLAAGDEIYIGQPICNQCISPKHWNDYFIGGTTCSYPVVRTSYSRR